MRKNKIIPLIVFVVSFSYYAILSSRIYTWVFGSGDSGGWLASALTWYPPQPFGNPLYVLLGHGLAALPGDLVIKYTIIGSCLASAITVSLVYLITLELTKSAKIGVLSAGVLLSSVVFLSQSITLSQYPLAVMWTTLAFWFYLRDNHKLSAVALGLGTAMHFIVGVTALVWLALEWRQGRLRQWVGLIPLFLVFGVLPYTLTLWELWRAYGVLDIQVLIDFTSNTSGAGGLMVTELPDRLLRYTAWIVVSFGVALLPIVYGLRQRATKGYLLLLTPAVLVSWYYLTAQDPTVWHYLPWAIPSLSVLAGLGVTSLRKQRLLTLTTICGTVALLVANTIAFDADKAARQNPVAMTLYADIKSLPEGAVVTGDNLGWAGHTLKYVIASERPDIVYIRPGQALTELERGRNVYTVSIDTLEVTRWYGR